MLNDLITMSHSILENSQLKRFMPIQYQETFGRRYQLSIWLLGEFDLKFSFELENKTDAFKNNSIEIHGYQWKMPT